MKLPKKRYLFTVNAKATCSLMYSVSAEDEAAALASLKAGDQNSKLIYDEIHLSKFDDPVFVGQDRYPRSPNV